MNRAPSPVVVVGCGVAGLATALAAAPRPVHLIGRAQAGPGCTTALAQGGIAAALAPGDDADAHARDTLEAGAGHNDRAAVRYLVEHAADAVEWLQAQGVAFDRDGDGLVLGREGGHRCHRIVHAGGDASGARLLEALAHAARQAAHVHWRDPCEVDALLLRDGGVAGVRTRDAEGGGKTIETDDLVLATGGIGALFAATTNPPGADGNGLALAIAAGARVRDLEFVQFHPTALASGRPGALPLITEALRGAGARLLDDAGQPLMAGVHALGDLAPRDVVARRVWQALQAGGHAWLDATALAPDWPQRFPTVHAICQAHGIDPQRQRIPVTPAAHFHMGGIATAIDGRSSVPGLHAVGEVACNGVHGANRLASNSLLEGVVFGRLLGERLAAMPARVHGGGPHRLIERGPAATPEALEQLRELNWRALGPLRDGAGLQAALDEIACHPALRTNWQGALSTRMLAAALARKSSLGAHYRSDG